MIHDPYLPDLALSLQARRAMLADSLSDLADCTPLISLTVGQQLVADLGPERAQHVAQNILDQVERATQHQIRAAWAGDYEGPEDKRSGPRVIVWLVISAGVVLGTLGYLLFNSAASAAIEQRDLYRALGDAAPAYQVMQ